MSANLSCSQATPGRFVERDRRSVAIEDMPSERALTFDNAALSGSLGHIWAYHSVMVNLDIDTNGCGRGLAIDGQVRGTVVDLRARQSLFDEYGRCPHFLRTASTVRLHS